MRRIKLVLLTIAIIVLGIVCIKKFGTSALSEVVKTAISKATTDINQAFILTRDYKAYVNAYYAKDATVLFPNSEAIKGRDTIIANFSLFESTMNVFPIIHDINGKNDLAYVYDTVKMETDAKVELEHSKYLEIWKNQNDHKWQVTYDIYNTSVPMAADTTRTKN